jgi:hypothetical protein
LDFVSTMAIQLGTMTRAGPVRASMWTHAPSFHYVNKRQQSKGDGNRSEASQPYVLLRGRDGLSLRGYRGARQVVCMGRCLVGTKRGSLLRAPRLCRRHFFQTDDSARISTCILVQGQLLRSQERFLYFSVSCFSAFQMPKY